MTLPDDIQAAIRRYRAEIMRLQDVKEIREWGRNAIMDSAKLEAFEVARLMVEYMGEDNEA